MNERAANIGGRMARGAVWMVGVRMGDRLVGLISTVILARLLLPGDFGIVALAITIIAALEIWSEFGFDMALIRDQSAKKAHYDTAWTLNVLRSVVVAVLIVAFAAPLADFFGETRIEAVLYFLAVMSVLEGFQSIRVVDFSKNLELHKEFAFLMSARAVQFAVTVTLAFLWREYWALVAGILANRFMKLTLSFVLAPYRPCFTLSALRELFGFSKWIVANSVLHFIGSRLDTIVIGRLGNVSAVGLYNIAYEISNMATTELVWPISRAIFPGFAQLADRRAELVRTYNLSLSVIVLIALPATTGIALTADYFVPLLLGDRWLDAIPIMQVLAVYGGLRVLVANTGSLYLAINKPYLVTVMAIVNLAILAPLMIWFVRDYGPIGAAWAVVAAAAPMVVLMFVFNQRYVGVSFAATVPYLVRPIFASAVMIAVLLAVRDLLPVSDGFVANLWRFLLLVAVGMIVYTVSVLAAWRLVKHEDGIEPVVLRLVRDRIARVRAG